MQGLETAHPTEHVGGILPFLPNPMSLPYPTLAYVPNTDRCHCGRFHLAPAYCTIHRSRFWHGIQVSLASAAAGRKPGTAFIDLLVNSCDVDP
jgi:hypothetical protein